MMLAHHLGAPYSFLLHFILFEIFVQLQLDLSLFKKMPILHHNRGNLSFILLYFGGDKENSGKNNIPNSYSVATTIYKILCYYSVFFSLVLTHGSNLGYGNYGTAEADSSRKLHHIKTHQQISGPHDSSRPLEEMPYQVKFYQ